MQTTPEFDAALQAFVKGCEEIRRKYHEANFTFAKNTTLRVERKRRWIAIETNDRGGIYCFIDPTNGDVLKPESWKKPAMHARGNLFDASGGLAKMGPYGPAYLR